ncbi:MAG: response regulator transcription factor [Desulfobacterales bacterium]|nr:response regulator transcription factor [Desulfobacterales bacterium]MBF0395809.1 response regulator transcription factor [Desulfobacterales bacterium]
MQILLVDDEEELVSTIAERLSYRGIEADWATSGEEALKLVNNKKYDLAVLDIKMPKMGGLKLKKLINKKCPDMKFIFLTGHGSEEDFKEGTTEAGVDYYLVKPVKIEALMEKMKTILKQER